MGGCGSEKRKEEARASGDSRDREGPWPKATVACSPRPLSFGMPDLHIQKGGTGKDERAMGQSGQWEGV